MRRSAVRCITGPRCLLFLSGRRSLSAIAVVSLWRAARRGSSQRRRCGDRGTELIRVANRDPSDEAGRSVVIREYGGNKSWQHQLKESLTFWQR